MDNDDEVRDRATYFRAILDKQEAALNSMYILNGMQVPPSRLPFLQCCASGVIRTGSDLELGRVKNDLIWVDMIGRQQFKKKVSNGFLK
jgi:hypothetical protein